MSAKILLKDFVKSTSIKGLGKAVKAEDRFIRYSWTVCVIFGAAMTTYLVSNILLQYYKFDTSTSIVEIKGKPGPPFPDITVCKLNPIEYDETLYGQYEERFYEVYMEMTEVLAQHINVSVNYNDYEENNYYSEDAYDTNTDAEYESYDMDSDVEEAMDDPVLAMMQTLEQRSGYFQFIDVEDIKKSTNNTFLLRTCKYHTWKGIQISCKKVRPRVTFMSPEYPQCLSFQIPQTHTQQTYSFVGIFYMNDFQEEQNIEKEIVLLNDNQRKPQKYESILNSHQTSARGVKVFLHQMGTEADPQNGLLVSPGMESTITVNVMKRQHLPAPYGNCVEYNAIDNVLSKTGRSCTDLCTQKSIMETCDCLSAYLPESGLKTANTSFCGDVKAQTEVFMKRLRCLYAIQDEESPEGRGIFEACDKECPQECEEFVYMSQQTYATWPHDDFRRQMFHKYIGNIETFPTHIKNSIIGINSTPEESLSVLKSVLEKNLLKISVIMRNRYMEGHIDTQKVTGSQILGGVGGSMNLWIGISFVTVVELCELLYSLCSSLVTTQKSRKTQVSHKGNETDEMPGVGSSVVYVK